MRAPCVTKWIAVAAWMALAADLAACGGGGGGGSAPPPSAAPSSLHYPMCCGQIWVNFAMTPLTPTVTGQVTSWTVSPALPAGITLNATTGVISGTPTVASDTTGYKVTAANASGSSTTTVSFAVSATSVAYQYASYVLAPGVPAQIPAPQATAPATTAWNAKPALPPGLILDQSNGAITGLPTTAAATASYTITASSSQGQVSTTLTLTVAGTRLVDLGLGSFVQLIRYVNSSVLSQDFYGGWVLQDYSSGATLARGAGFSFLFAGNALVPTFVDLEGNVMVDETPAALVHLGDGVLVDPTATALEVRSATTGQVLTTIPVAEEASCNPEETNCPIDWFRLATDGSYVVGGSSTALTVWSTASGQMLFSLAGDYSQPYNPPGLQPFAAPGQVQIADGPAGANVIQTITVPGGVSSVSPTFQGTFSSWFVDGQRFLSTQNNTVWTYSAAAVQQGIVSLSTTEGLAGSGNWFWTLTDYETLNVYKVGTTTAALTIANCCSAAVASGTTLGLLNSGANYQSVTVIDLSGASPTSTSYANVGLESTYGAQSATQWLVGNPSGVVLDGASVGGTPRTLTLGRALSIAAGSNYISVATAAGKILFFNASTNALAGTIDFPAVQLAASTDGTVLAAYEAQGTNSTLNVYSLPAGTIVNTFPYTAPSMELTYIGLSGSGTAAAEMFERPSTECLIQVIAVAGGSPIVCDNSTTDANVQLSPDGTLTAISGAPSVTVSSNIYKNGTLATAVPGYALGWLDNNRLLLNNYTEPMCCLQSTGLTIYDATGSEVGTSPVTTLDPLQIAPGSSSLYDLKTNTIVSLTSGVTTWTSGSESYATFGGTNVGALTPSQVVFAADNTVVAVPY
jgi:hypothetical protein